MDVINAIINAENMKALILIVAAVAGFIWVEKRITASLHKELNGLGVELRGEMKELAAELRGEMKELAAELRGEMNALAAALRGEMNERFTAFHKTLKENDFAHLNETIQTLTHLLHKNGMLEPDDKQLLDSRLNKVKT